MVPFEAACTLLERALRGGVRRGIVADLAASGDMRRALRRLRDRMRRHDWSAPGAGALDLAPVVDDCDARTRREGLHALHDWDGKADHVNENSIPVDVLDYLITRRGDERPDAAALAILVDYYFAYVLALLSLRIWDGGDADANLERLGRLLERLQGPDGSGQRFAADPETLILIATSHFELEERGYHTLLERVRTLSPGPQVKVALGHAASIGCHLRFGFEATYGRDTSDMRDDNVADYPWLCFSLAVLMDAFVAGPARADETVAREAIVEALLNGLSADARAFVGQAPRSLAGSAAERATFRHAFEEHRGELLAAFERYRPSERTYSPLSFFFNFSHNVLKGTVVDALLRGRPWTLALNDLLTSAPRGEGEDSQQALATTLMAYARAAPDTIRGRLMPVIVYDPSAGRQAFSVTMRKLEGD